MKKLILLFIIIYFPLISAQSKEDCLICHDDPDFKAKIDAKTVSLYVSGKTFSSSVHGTLDCVDCHTNIDAENIPHRKEYAKVNCGGCHDDIQKLYAECLHGKAKAKGDPLAPLCQDCHGNHDILPAKDHNSAVAPMKIPYLCGRCHREGTPVQLQRHIPQDRILENYTESIHGEGLLVKGLTVSATCVSCHSAHRILPHTDPRSTISRENIAKTCSVCHSEIETVHRKVIRGELWEKQAHVLPACVDCHQPHEIRKVYYDYGMADKD
jgi:nitrate/TMAO reductase-like tetraheme cytochrome c subunit